MSAVAERVGIVGAGSFGTALATLVASEGREVVIYTQTEAVAEEINRNVHNITSVAGQTLDGARQNADSAGELAQLAAALQAEVSDFRV